MTGTEGLYGPPVQAAEMLRERIHRELGFTVNIGVSSNKLLAKIAGDFQKPNRVHSLFPEEIPGKLWPLPVRDLFLVGPATERKLRRMGIGTIGELAHAPVDQLRRALGKQGGDHLAFCQRPQCRPSAPGPNRKQGLWQLRDLAQRRDRPAYGPSGAPESV